MTPWILALAVAASCVAAVTDLRTRTIPNWLTFPLPLLAAAARTLDGGAHGLLLSLVGAVVCFLPVYFLFVRHALGGGDVKLFTGLGALLGARDGLELELTAFTLVALFALLVMALRGQLLRMLGASLRASLHLLAPARFVAPDTAVASMELPMGLAILCATLALSARSAL